MGASGWSYIVEYQPDLNKALHELREKVFAEGDYYWAAGERGEPRSALDNGPATIEELFADEAVQESGTHSIIDVIRVLADGDEPGYCTVQPVTPAEALRHTGTELLGREHLKAIEDLAEKRWFGRCAVLHKADGTPEEICFWGFSGD